jgi:hypothetical protein
VASGAEEGVEVRIHEETHDNSHRYRCVDASAAFAGAVYAKTTITTTSTTTTTSASNTRSTSWPLEPFLGPLLGQTQNKNLTSFCHNREVRHERVIWYKQLPTYQKERSAQRAETGVLQLVCSVASGPEGQTAEHVLTG